MASITHYINTAEVEPSRARTPSLITTTPQPFPVLFLGDTRSHQFFFQKDGSIESFSGDATYSFRVTVGDPDAGPFEGSYTATCGETTVSLPYNSNASTFENALNALATVIAQGGVTVIGEFPTFLIYNKVAGTATAITGNATLLGPDSSITATVLTTGDSSHRQQTQFAIRRNAVASQGTWTAITSPYAGWQGTLTTNTEAASALLAESGESIGGYLQVQTLVNVEVIDPSNNIVAYYQTTCFLRGKNVDAGASVPIPTPSFLTNGVQNRPLIVGLASAISDSTKLGGLTTAAGAIPTGSVFMLNFSVTINDGAGTHSGIMTLLYQLQASTQATAWPLWGRPYDYNGATNAVAWRLLGCYLDTLPASWNASTSKFHYMGAAGAAGAVYMYADQTGTSAPA